MNRHRSCPWIIRVKSTRKKVKEMSIWKHLVDAYFLVAFIHICACINNLLQALDSESQTAVSPTEPQKSTPSTSETQAKSSKLYQNDIPTAFSRYKPT